MEELVEIVMTTYNGERFVAGQLRSLLSQTHKNIRIQVYDDLSSDGTEAIVKEFADRDERVIWHKNPKNLGYTHNFLRGVMRTEADYVMLCDQDDIWKEDKVAKTLEFMIANERESGKVPVLVFTDADVYNGRTIENRSFQKSTHLNPKNVDIGHLLMENKCIGCTVMVNKCLVQHLGRIPSEIRFHDWWLALIAASFGRVCYLDEMTLLYRQHGDNQVGGTGFAGYVKKRLAGLADQKSSIRATYRQGRLFYGIYRGELKGKSLEVVKNFAMMENASFVRRRLNMFRYGYKKSGTIRNIGLFLLM